MSDWLVGYLYRTDERGITTDESSPGVVIRVPFDDDLSSKVQAAIAELRTDARSSAEAAV